jgi:threonine synthase
LTDTVTAREFFGEVPEIVVDADIDAAAAAAGLV